MTDTPELSTFERTVASVCAGTPLDEAVERLLAQLTPDERLFLLDGDAPFWEGMAELMHGDYNVKPIEMGRVDRLGIPGLRFSDGPRGAVIGRSTAFPVAMARGATWDVDLERKVGEAIGAEIRAQGGNFFGGVCINLPRHPAWGRAQETYGEDSHLLGEFGAALTTGVREHTMAVVKHFALNSMENARFSVDVEIDDAALQEVYLPHFRRVVEAGADAVMTAYNKVNGEWAGESRRLMTEILRDEWGFTGITVSDFIFGLRDPAGSLRAGLDVEEPFRQQRAAALPAELKAGRLAWADVDAAARRILRTHIAFAARDLAPAPGAEVVFSAQHRALSREVAATAAVLLKNDVVDGSPVLPLRAAEIRSLAVVGRLAAIANTGDAGSSSVRSPQVVTPIDGLRAALPESKVVLVDSEDPAEAARAAGLADAAVVVVGYTAEDEGEYLDNLFTDPELTALFPPLPEGMTMDGLLAPPGGEKDDEAHPIIMGGAVGGDRRSIRLHDADVATIRAVAAVNKRTIVVLVTAGAVISEEWRSEAAAILVGWYNGSEGGHALADVLLGVHDATGRLPYSIPTDEEHLPFFDIETDHIVYDRWHGQRLLDREGIPAAFPLGWGLSYTTFSMNDLDVGEVAAEVFTASVTVANTGDRPGRHVVQVYARTHEADAPERVLVGFAPVALDAGEARRVSITCSLRPLARWVDGRFVLPTEPATIEASAYSGDPAALTANLHL